MPLFLRTNWSAVAVSLAAITAPLGCGSESGTPPAAMGGSTAVAGTSGSGGTQATGGTGGTGGSVAGTAGVGGAAAGNAGVGGSGGSAAGAGGSGGAGGASGGGAGGAGGASGGGAGGAGGGAGQASGGAMAFGLTSPVLTSDITCEPNMSDGCGEFPMTSLHEPLGGDNVSPELNWGSEPAGTMSYAIVLHDLSFNNTHWAMWNIPAGMVTLDTGLPSGAMPATPDGASQASFIDGEGYVGPGVSGNVYEFRLYALNVADFQPASTSPNPENAVRSELEDDPNGIVLDSSTLRGKSP